MISLGWGSVLFIVFLVLKLTHEISWSWWWVTSPLWISAILGFILMGAGVGFAVVLKRWLG